MSQSIKELDKESPIGFGKCECEHDCHFGPKSVRQVPEGTAHPYGVKRELFSVKTDYGTFHVCKGCAESCLAIYMRIA